MNIIIQRIIVVCTSLKCLFNRQ